MKAMKGAQRSRSQGVKKQALRSKGVKRQKSRGVQKQKSQGAQTKKTLPSGSRGVKKHIVKSKQMFRGVAYARQSSGSTWTHGRKRQHDAGLQALKDHFGSMGAAKMDLNKVGEIKSGSLPLHKRQTLVDLIKDPTVDAIGVENLRAVSRKMLYGELFYDCLLYTSPSPRD